MALLGHDLVNVLVWWLALFALGVLFLPVTARVFSRFFDFGYPFSKVLGLAVVAYGSWLASSLRLLPFSRGSLVVCVLASALVVYSRKRNRDKLVELMRGPKRLFLLEEAAFLIVLVSWAYLRGVRPEILGLEKFMDFGFSASIARSRYMPPGDMWFAGESLNYYYFGHYVLAMLSKLSGIRLAVAYNLMIATLAALCFCLTFSLTANLVHATKRASLKQVWLAGALSAVLLTFGGNLHPFVFAYVAPLMETLKPATDDPASGGTRRYWYSDATRYVGYNPPTHERTIHEFPFYSFVVADLHAHVSSLPFVLTFLALLAAFLLEPATPSQHVSVLARAGPLRFALWVGLALTVMRMTNAWDLPIYGFIALVVLFTRSILVYSLARGSWVTVLTFGATLVVMWLSSLPFTFHFQNHYGRLGWVEGTTPFHQLLVLWGVPLTFVFLYFLVGTAEALPWLKRSRPLDFVETPFKAVRALPRADLLALILTLSALGLVLLPEIVYVRDIYVDFFYRANTYFKLTYQAFVLFSVLTGYFVVRVLGSPTGVGRSWVTKAICLLVLPLPLLYTTIGIQGHYGRLHPFHYKGLDGLAFLETYRPGDAEAVRWLNAHVDDPRVILEANGLSYTDFGRMSMATGLPTVLGWYVHEWLWRGDTVEVDRRAADIASAYESDNAATTREILRKYQVEYIIVGELERNRFGALNEPGLVSLGEIVLDADGTKIIQVRDD